MATGGEGVWLAKAWLPAVTKVMIAQNRLERRIALLRAIEALRMHAAANGGQLPESLDQVTIAPVAARSRHGQAVRVSPGWKDSDAGEQVARRAARIDRVAISGDGAMNSAGHRAGADFIYHPVMALLRRVGIG